MLPHNLNMLKLQMIAIDQGGYKLEVVLARIATDLFVLALKRRYHRYNAYSSG